MAKPFMKWAGGKIQLVDKLIYLFPPEIFSGKIDKYVEPFIGGGALFFYVAQSFPYFNKFFLSDINEELILTYKSIQIDVEGIISLLSTLEDNYHALNNYEQKDFFYKTREKFNKNRIQINFNKFHNNWLERAATIIFLNRTCFNGLFRVNSKGEFNVPFGDYKNPKICNAENLRGVSALLKKADIKCVDFSSNKEFIDEKTFVYFDPPYRPISKTANFTSYSKCIFGDDSQKNLAKYYRLLSEKGAKLMLSNSDPKNKNPDDCFFEVLYSNFRIERVDASRMINSNRNGRGKIKELVIMNY
ncbi:Modification methylase MjaIII [Gammaproteobacteria bacterium]